MPTSTSRLNLTQPAGSDSPSLLRTSIGGNATTLDNSVLVTEGTLAGRPAANTVEKDRVYKATDTAQWFLSDGTNWNTMIVAGQWQTLTLGSGIVSAGEYTPSVRLEGDIVRLKGGLLNNSGSTISAGTTLATIPASLRPSSANNLTVVSSVGSVPVELVVVTVTGVIKLDGVETFPNAQVLGLDGVTYTLS